MPGPCGWGVTCRVVLGEQAHAVFMAEGGGKQHGRDGCGIECGLNLLRCTIVEQSCNARGFACSASMRAMRRRCWSVTSQPVVVSAAAPPPPPPPPPPPALLPAAAARCSAVSPSPSTAFATYRAQPPRASSRSMTASSRPAAAAACRGHLRDSV